MANRKRTTSKGPRYAPAHERNERVSHRRRRRVDEDFELKDYLLEPHPELGFRVDGAVIGKPTDASHNQ